MENFKILFQNLYGSGQEINKTYFEMNCNFFT